MNARRRLRTSRGRFRRYVQRAVDALPPRFRAAQENLVVVVEKAPSPDDYERGTEDAVRVRPTLFGIYRGTPLSERTAGYHLAAPDVIAIFRRPLLRYSRNRKRLRHEIERTVLHEYGHYFGLDEPAVEHL